MRFPDRSTVIGQTINSYLTNGIDMDDHAIHLLFSANRWELSTKMKEKAEIFVHFIENHKKSRKKLEFAQISLKS